MRQPIIVRQVEAINGNVVRVLTFQHPPLVPHYYDARCTCNVCKDQRASEVARVRAELVRLDLLVLQRLTRKC